MRLPILLVAILALASCAPEALLCSEDPDCEPAGCGPHGCLGGGKVGSGGAGGGGGAGGFGGAGGSGGTFAEVPPVCDAMCQHVYQLCGTILVDELGMALSFGECVESCAAGVPTQAEAACVVESPCFTWDTCFTP